jgi:hypothetical protein
VRFTDGLFWGCAVQSGREASLVAQVVEVEKNDMQAMQTVRDPPVITINKSATYAIYDLSYIRVNRPLRVPLINSTNVARIHCSRFKLSLISEASWIRSPSILDEHTIEILIMVGVLLTF